jgi:hypothetical protein
MLYYFHKELKSMNEENWTDNTEANEDAIFLTQAEYDAMKGALNAVNGLDLFAQSVNIYTHLNN